MEDVNFINDRLRRGQQAIEKFEKEFSSVTKEQLNWKPTAQSWSIAECLQHLLVADRYYFQDLQQIGHNTYKMTFWEKHSPLSGLLGKVLKDQMKEQVKRKMTTHQKLTPISSAYELDILLRYKNNLNEFIQLTDECRNADVDKCIINSPTITWITYSLRDALEFLFEHEHRHLNQAIRVKNHKGFPKT
jgi:uncharacterized damage-inducible protein DinB